ncbi:hypothetical protein N7493_008379 [Penicillium malachiteum]|uniref:Uncharacterized protein n=1 Tax=Penicillium malachiteum TaxID=1324776 RepID=A0AAD6HH30_9EURO|nr:hypothetical protein N7493_008379 [Penicillium malachiteum]
MASNQAPPSFMEQLKSLFDPPSIMLMALPHHIRVWKEAIFTGNILAPIFQFSRLRDEAFGRFWVEFSGEFLYDTYHINWAMSHLITGTRPRDDTNAEPVGSSALIPPLLKSSEGIVLDIGPGTGTQMHLLTSKSIKALYGPEPCVGLHAQLRKRAITAGITEKYHILPCGVVANDLLPALRATGTGVTDAYDSDPKSGIFDTILCVRVLCSVPAMENTVKELYGLLKPGGRLLVTEHVVNKPFSAKGSVLARVAQAVWMWLGWRLLIGDCCLDRDTETVLRKAAGDEGWESVELEKSFEWSAMPYLSGVLTKKNL